MSNYGKVSKESLAQLERFVEQHEKTVADTVFRAMVHVVPADRLTDSESCDRMLHEAEMAGKIVAVEMLKDLVSSGVMSSLVRVARSRGSWKAGRKKKSHKGAARAAWRTSAEAVLRRRRNLDVPTAELVEALVNNLVIDQADGGRYECHETGAQVASSERNMAAEVSRLKNRVVKERASKGI
ncbi:hypothetical protein [Thauera humireducens]|uniref:hypothetical protein n=1 Tax=Thauera humireducens TaxID=1134435 RepID=UPI0024A99278|nr:hypothetical protein [Thauera humireducens]